MHQQQHINIEHTVLRLVKKTRWIAKKATDSRYYLSQSAKNKKRKQEIAKMMSIMRKYRITNAEKAKKHGRLGFASQEIENVSISLTRSVLAAIQLEENL